MSIEDTIGYQNEVEACAVCGKNVEHGGGFARLKHGRHLFSLCCPLCLETFQKDPTSYVARFEKVLHYRALRDLTK